MKRNILLSTVLLLFTSFSLIAFAQEAELSLTTKITATIEKSEPEWKLDRKAILPNQIVIRWASEKGRVLVSVAMLASEAKAQEALKSKVNEWEHLPESKVSKEEIKDFGDEGYLLKIEGASGVQIFFRKGDCEIQAFGPSEVIARRFAQHVSDLLPPSNHALIRTRTRRVP